MNYIPTILWTAVATLGVWITARAIGKNTALISAAEDQHINPYIVSHLKNVLFTYRTRFWLIVNNLVIGVLALLGATGMIGSWLGTYVAFSLLVNEATLIYLTYRDQRNLTKSE